MFSPWFFHSWIFSLGSMLLIFSILTGFGVLVNALMCWIWGEEDTETAAQSRTAKEPPMSRAA